MLYPNDTWMEIFVYNPFPHPIRKWNLSHSPYHNLFPLGTVLEEYSLQGNMLFLERTSLQSHYLL